MGNNEAGSVSARTFVRERRLLRAEMQHPRFGLIGIVIRNVSARGLGGKCAQEIAVGELVTIFLPHSVPVEGAIVWRKGHGFGVHLASRINPTEVKNAAGDRSEPPYQVPIRFRSAIETRRPGFKAQQ